MQFYAIAPLVTVPFVYGYHSVGLLVTLLLLLCQVTSLTYLLEFNEAIDDSKFVDNVYVKPWTRAGPYAVGLALGCMLSVMKSDYKIHKALIAFGWLISASVATALTFSVHIDPEEFDVIPNLDSDSSLAYEIVKSPLWALSVAWVVFACHCGHGVESAVYLQLQRYDNTAKYFGRRYIWAIFFQKTKMTTKEKMYQNCVTEEEVRHVSVTWQESYANCEKRHRKEPENSSSPGTVGRAGDVATFPEVKSTSYK
ncbi:hypothetical protein Btru_002547 [Bulinus truncatus]|nr:hypothetical protein Btru_002547 [Bulinus truncatus]